MIAIVKEVQGRGDCEEHFVGLYDSVGQAIKAIEEDRKGPCPGKKYDLTKKNPGSRRQYATVWEFEDWEVLRSDHRWH